MVRHGGVVGAQNTGQEFIQVETGCNDLLDELNLLTKKATATAGNGLQDRLERDQKFLIANMLADAKLRYSTIVNHLASELASASVFRQVSIRLARELATKTGATGLPRA